MAYMIPEKLNVATSTKGEQRLFELLSRLPDDNIVYYEPIIANRYPDFVVISPKIGVLIIEDKGWMINEIIESDHDTVKIKKRNGDVESMKHPFRQAREYMYRLMEHLRKNSLHKILMHEAGDKKNKFQFPFSFAVSLSNIEESQINAKGLDRIFDQSKTLYRDSILDLLEKTEPAIEQKLKTFFDPWWDFGQLNNDQIKALRVAIHPEAKVIGYGEADNTPDKPVEISKIKALDLQQERNARKIGDGHRIMFGVAGSGKTVLLVSRGKLLSQDLNMNILVLCFNVALSAFLKFVFREQRNVIVYHFDGWCKHCGVTRRRGESNGTLGKRFLETFENGNPDYRKFNSVLIDEAQDFDPVWFKCVTQTLKDPLDGDLLIVGDGNQGIYSQTNKITWKSLGIKATGRVVGRKGSSIDLLKNYRNSREIIELAASFANDIEDDDGMVSLKPDPNVAVRSTGIVPVLKVSYSVEDEFDFIYNKIRELTSSNKAHLNQIGIMYPYLAKQYSGAFKSFRDRISKEIGEVNWAINKNGIDNRSRINGNSIRVQTIHQAKGLQFKAVFIIWTNLMPRSFTKNPNEDDALMYVALTRPTDYLFITAHNNSDFVDRIENTGAVEIE